MSREVDMSDLESLSEEDLKYLHDRSMITDAQLAELLGISPTELQEALREATQSSIPLEKRANTGTANTANLSPEEYQRQVQDSEPDEDEEDEEEESYEDMTNDQLRAELAGRELSTSGNKQEMIKRLLEDDESEEDEDDEE